MECDFSSFAIKRIQTFICPNPELARPVFSGPVDIVAIQAGIVAGVVAVMFDQAGTRIEAVEASASG